MESVAIDDLRAFVSNLNGQMIATRVRRLRFQLRATDEGLEYTPTSTGKRRRQAWRFVERALRRYNETRSMHPGDYRDLSVNASYFLAVIGAYLDSRPAAGRG